MPNCYICGKETPVTDFYLVRQYVNSYGYYWYFCSWPCLKKWANVHITKPAPPLFGGGGPD